MKILVTGFEPFGGMDVNPTEQLVKTLQEDGLDGYQLYTATLPVIYERCVDVLITKVDQVKPDYVICCGLAFGRAPITVERIGINVKDTAGEGEKGDNTGEKPVDEKIDRDGPDGIFSTLPIRAMVNKLQKNNIPAQISNSAGTYICNNTLYGILHYIEKNALNIKAGFVHFPATPDMVINKPNVPSLSFQQQLEGLKTLIATIE